MMHINPINTPVEGSILQRDTFSSGVVTCTHVLVAQHLEQFRDQCLTHDTARTAPNYWGSCGNCKVSQKNEDISKHSVHPEVLCTDASWTVSLLQRRPRVMVTVMPSCPLSISKPRWQQTPKRTHIRTQWKLGCRDLWQEFDERWESREDLTMKTNLPQLLRLLIKWSWRHPVLWRQDVMSEDSPGDCRLEESQITMCLCEYCRDEMDFFCHNDKSLFLSPVLHLVWLIASMLRREWCRRIR